MPRRKTVRSERRLERPRRTPEHKSEILARYQLLIDSGSSSLDASKAAGASISSIKRWQKIQVSDKFGPNSLWASARSIDIAIEVLSLEQKCRLKFLGSLFKLIVWLRWPTQPEQHPSAISGCIVTYLSQKTDAQTLSELNDEDLNLITQHLRLDLLRQLYSDQYLDMPLFTEHCIDDQPYDYDDVLADVVRFMLGYKPGTKSRKDSATLERAHYCLKYGIHRYKCAMSKSTFWKLWLTNGAAAPFHYVLLYDFAQELIPNPLREDFAKKVDHCADHRVEIRNYLAHCRWAVEALSTKLTTKSKNSVGFPQFPASLNALQLAPLPLSPLIREHVLSF